MNYLKDHRGIGMLTGEPGSGKTSSLRAFVASLNPSLYKVAYFPLSTVTVQDFYRGLAFTLGLEPAFRKVDLFKQIQDAIHSLFFERKVVPFIILDELQLASTQFLSDLHLLFNFSMDSVNPFVLVLCGLRFLILSPFILTHPICRPWNLLMCKYPGHIFCKLCTFTGISS